MTVLSDEEIEVWLTGGDWSREGNALHRELERTDFAAAIELVNRIAEVAQRADHHPDITVHDYNKVGVSLSTHSAGGITAKDLDLAAEIERLASG